MADTDVRLAEAERRPDWSLEVAYAQRGPLYSNMVSIGVRIDLPIFEATRQNPKIASRLATAEQVRAQAEDARRAHLAEIRALLAEWQSGRAVAVPTSWSDRHERSAALADGWRPIRPTLEARRAGSRSAQ
jgi:outer membrane protein TolC